MNNFLVHIFQRHFEVKIIVLLDIKHNPGRSIRPNFGHIYPRGQAFPVKSKSISAKQPPGKGNHIQNSFHYLRRN